MNQSFIYNQSHTKKSIQENCYYCQIGFQDFIDKENNPRIKEENNNKVIAKIKFKDNNQPKYLIRLDNNKKLFNPNLQNEAKGKNKPIDLFIPNSDSFKEVSKKVFDFYLNFLRTSNNLWINHAEREDF
jgi:hypothetical protein